MQKAIIFSTLLMEVLGFSIIIPAFPELIAYYHIGEFQVVLGLTVYSLFAFLAAPILWQRSDKIGRKKSLARCIVGTSLSYFMLTISPTYIIFLIARAINWVTGWNISILQAILTDISPDPATKAKNFWLMWAVFGLGFIIGPFLGSLILWWGGVDTIFIFGGCLAALQLILVLVWFRNTNELDHHKVLIRNPFTVITKFLRKPTLQPWLISLIFLGVGMFIMNSSQSLYMHAKFGTSGERYGYLLAVSWVILAVNMAVLVPKFWRKVFTTRGLLIRIFGAMLLGFMLLSLMQTEISYILTLYVMMLCSGAYGVVYNIYIMSHAQKNEIGEISGMMWSLQSLFMVIWPVIWWVMLETDLNIHRGSFMFVLIALIIMLKPLRTMSDVEHLAAEAIPSH